VASPDACECWHVSVVSDVGAMMYPVCRTRRMTSSTRLQSSRRATLQRAKRSLRASTGARSATTRAREDGLSESDEACIA
jgi:hypothetical protein